MDSNQHKGLDTARMIWIVSSPIVFTVGVFGNILTIIVLAGRKNKKTSSTTFLTFLAFADLLVMTILLPRWWFIYMFDFDVRHINNVVCKLHFFLTYFSGAYSASIMSAVTIERTICTVKPYKVKTLCTVNIAIVISVLLMILLIAIHGHILFGMKMYGVTVLDTPNGNSYPVLNETMENFTYPCEDMLQDIYDSEPSSNMSAFSSDSEMLCEYFSNEITERNLGETSAIMDTSENKVLENVVITLDLCWFDDPQYGLYFSDIHQKVAIVGCLVIPEMIFAISGIIIVRKLQRSKQLRMRMLTDYMRDSGYKPTYDQRATQITRTLLLVNFVFVVTTTPAYIFLVGRSAWVDENTGMTATQEIIWAIVNQMTFFNHAVNFILYFLSGSRFRKKVLDMFRCQKSPNSSDARSSGTVSSY